MNLFQSARRRTELGLGIGKQDDGGIERSNAKCGNMILGGGGRGEGVYFYQACGKSPASMITDHLSLRGLRCIIK